MKSLVICKCWAKDVKEVLGQSDETSDMIVTTTVFKTETLAPPVDTVSTPQYAQHSAALYVLNNGDCAHG